MRLTSTLATTLLLFSTINTANAEQVRSWLEYSYGMSSLGITTQLMARHRRDDMLYSASMEQHNLVFCDNCAIDEVQALALTAGKYIDIGTGSVLLETGLASYKNIYVEGESERNIGLPVRVQLFFQGSRLGYGLGISSLITDEDVYTSVSLSASLSFGSVTGSFFN